MSTPDDGELPFDRVQIGDRYSVSRTVTDAESALFATLSGSKSPCGSSPPPGPATRSATVIVEPIERAVRASQ